MFFIRRSPDSFREGYNWFSRFYWLLEKQTIKVLRQVLAEHFPPSPALREKTVIEYGCGSGCLTVELARLFKTAQAKDISEGMLERARRYARKSGVQVEFSQGNLLDITEEDNSYDYIFLSFSLHLFAPTDQERILRELVRVAREKVVIIEHTREWNPLIAVIEWIEGGYYDTFIKTDFSPIAQRIKARNFSEVSCDLYTLLLFVP
jgi:ubiquinone/menaquinone biosynthesis C-methylase UbiE